MVIEAANIAAYIQQISPEFKDRFEQLFQVVQNNIPDHFEKGMLYNMPSFYVPLSYYLSGYHCKPKQHLPFISVAAQKNFIALYHMGVYADNEVFDWFVSSYTALVGRKPDMGKSCIRFSKNVEIPTELIAELCRKMSADRWIELYEMNFKR